MTTVKNADYPDDTSLKRLREKRINHASPAEDDADAPQRKGDAQEAVEKSKTGKPD